MSVLKVPSLFTPEVHRHVKDMEHHVVMYKEIVEKTRIERREDDETEAESFTIQKRDDLKECCEKKNKVQIPISINDLFRPRSLQAGTDKSEIRKVLLCGNPGSGKTCISKAIAYKWALGEIMQEFKAIYVVPIRRLGIAEAEAVRGGKLEELVARMCFEKERSDDAFEELLEAQIKYNLDMSNTLLVLDGLDEAGYNAKALLTEAEERACKILVLTRPYNLQGIRTNVDCQFECLGLNDQQLRNFVYKELHQNDASRLVHSLEEVQGIWETAHTPMTAHILCSWWKEHGTAIEDQGKRASMFQIYGKMTDFVWKSFEEKSEARMADKNTIFSVLEKIAFEALRSGQILIEQGIVEGFTRPTNTSSFFKESGFLLLILEGQQYQFPHLTFQEYFAGRYIASSLRENGSNEENQEVLQFIEEGKYNQKHALAISFAMNAFARGQSKFALQKMLLTVDKDPIEILGIQHFFLRMRVLEASLEETEENSLKDLLKDGQAIELAESARQLLERTFDDVLTREIVIENLQQVPRVLQEFPRVIQDTIGEVKKNLECSHNLTWMEMAKISDVLKLARHSSEQSNLIIQHVLQLVQESNSWCNSKEHIRRLSSIAEHMPQQASELLSTLVETCGNRKDENVLKIAMKTIGHIAAASPQHASKLLAVLEKACGDQSEDVRRLGIEAIGLVVAAAPQHAGEVLPTLKKACIDRSKDVRRVGIEAIGRIAAAAPQYADKILPTLEKACRSPFGDMCRLGIEAIGRIGAEAPQHAGEVLPTLEKACRDQSEYVRRLGIEATGLVVAAAPQHAGEFLLTLVETCGNRKDENVLKKAMKTIGHIAAASPQHANKLLAVLEKACGDQSKDVRRLGIEAIGHIGAEAPQYSSELLSMLAKRYADEDEDVCEIAMKTIGRIAAAAPQYADKILPTLEKACRSLSEDMCRLGIEATGLVVASAPQHAGKFLLMLEEYWNHIDTDAIGRIVLKAIGRVLVAAPQHAGKFLPMLAEAYDDTAFCRTSMETVGRVLVAAPQHANKFLETLKIGCYRHVGQEEHWNSEYSRQAAIKAIGHVVSVAPQYADEVLPVLEKVYLDYFEKTHVAQEAIEAIVCVSVAAPQHADHVLSTLAEVRNNIYLRLAAIKAIGRVVSAAPQHADKIPPMLAKACRDRFEDVRRVGIEAIGRIAIAAPQYADKILLMLAKACRDRSEDVRRVGIEAIGRIAIAAPQYADKILLMLAKACSDRSEDVRRVGIEAIGRIAIAAPQYAGEVMPTLTTACTENFEEVRFAARRALEGIKTEKVIPASLSSLRAHKGSLSIFFVQNSLTIKTSTKSERALLVFHTTSSEKIGRFERQSIDQFTWYLRGEFEKKFPNLLDKLLKSVLVQTSSEPPRKRELWRRFRV